VRALFSPLSSLFGGEVSYRSAAWFVTRGGVDAASPSEVEGDTGVDFAHLDARALGVDASLGDAYPSPAMDLLSPFPCLSGVCVELVLIAFWRRVVPPIPFPVAFPPGRFVVGARAAVSVCLAVIRVFVTGVCIGGLVGWIVSLLVIRVVLSARRKRIRVDRAVASIPFFVTNRDGIDIRV